MNVYSFESDCNRYQNLSLVNEEKDWEAIYRFNGTPIGSAWRPLQVELDDEDVRKKLLPGDCPCLFATAPVFTSRAAKVLRPFLDGNGELLPLESDHGEYFVFNVTRIVDALDEANSDIVRFPDGKRVMEIKEFVFVASRLANVDIFKLPQQPLGRVHVTDAFVQTTREAGLAGISFEWLWASDQSSSSRPLQSTKIQ